ncbi:MAG: GNAT family N-acetyltransferase [Novosphingobium sp.]|nr:GNAT family N-acetyltransferase [Novosphingobium sp.]
MSFDLADADAVAAHDFLTRSYWSPGISLETVRRGMEHSVCCTVHTAAGQVAMARVVSDLATFAYLSDVYVLEDHQGQGIAQAMMSALFDYPDLRGLRRWMLFTRDAHSLYARYGWEPLEHPERAMLLDLPEACS